MGMADVLLERQSVPFEKLLSFTPLSDKVRRKLSITYGLLVLGCLACALGVYVPAFVIPIPQFLALVGEVGFGAALVMSRNPGNKPVTGKRFAYFMGCSFCTGALASDFLTYVMYMHPDVLWAALLSSVAIFTCFSISGIFSPDRYYYYLGAILGSAIWYVAMIQMANIFFRSRLVDDALLLGTLVMLVGYTLYDTQVAIASFDMDNNDCVTHALQFFVDLFGIFIRIAIILTRKKEKDE